MSNKFFIAKVRSLFEHALCNGFKKGYHSATNIVMDEKHGMVPDDHSILASCRNYFSQLLNVHGVNGAWQTEEIHPATAEPLVPKASSHFKYLETILMNQNSIQEESKSSLKSSNACYHSV